MEESVSKIVNLNPTKIDKGEKAYSSVINLQSAIEEADIKNIALTGPYGSGKSSILLTLRDIAADYKFLNISLATLEANEILCNERVVDGHKIDKPLDCPLEKCKETNRHEDNKDINQLIEYSVLQQIIYKEEPGTIPQSRFKRIKHITPQKSEGFAWKSVGFLVSLLVLFKPDWFGNNQLYRMITLDRTLELLFEVFSLGFIIYALFSFIKYLTVALYNNNLNKINLKDGEIEIAETTSIFNRHLDEILYFFEVTKYDVVVFEDLDRFKNHNIFLKLRELNTLLNESEVVKRKIVFVYAIRDDIFKDTSRTKFFDYIETIIPVINPSNACDKLYKLLIDSGVNDITPYDCRELGQFVDDMRTLKNIVNEYLQYRVRLDIKLSPKKMLGLIIYKNYYPEDFSLLHWGKSIINNAFNSKAEYIKLATSEINSKIKKCEDEIEMLNHKISINKVELRTIYVQKYIEKLSNFVCFYHSDKDISVSELSQSDELFKLLYANKIASYKSFNSGTNRVVLYSFELKFEEIETAVDPNNKFLSRLEQVETGYIDKLKTELDKHAEAKYDIMTLPFSKLITKYEIEPFKKLFEENRLIIFLLQNGYIDEEYYNFISYFYPGTLTPTDKEFLLDLMIKKANEYSYSLQNIDALVSQIQKSYFQHESILNINLLDFIIEAETLYSAELKKVIDVVYRKRKIDFVHEYYKYSNSKNNSEFFTLLLSKWESFWDDVIKVFNQDNIPTEFVELFLRFRPVITKRKDNHSFIAYIENKYDLISRISNKYGTNEVFNVINSLNCKFKYICLSGAKDNMFKLIIQNDLYEINRENIREVIRYEADEEVVEKYFEFSSYTVLLNNLSESSFKYINSNLNDCLEHFFPESSVYEEEEALLQIINIESVNLSREVRDKYLKKQLNKISVLSAVNDIERKSTMELNLIDPTWKNIVYYFKFIGGVVDTILKEYIESNIDSLASVNFDSDIDQAQLENLFNLLFGTNVLSFDSYSSLLSLFSFSIQSWNSTELEEDRLVLLIKNSKLSFGESNFEKIQQNFDSEILIDFCFSNKVEFLDQIDLYSLYEDDMSQILISGFTEDEKKQILSANLTLDDISTYEFADRLTNFIISSNFFDLDFDMYIKVLSLGTLENKKVILANKISTYFDLNLSQIEGLLNSLGGKYAKLNESGPMPSFPKNNENEKLFNYLKSRDYVRNVFVKQNTIKVTTKLK